jgi:hypothetical protein
MLADHPAWTVHCVGILAHLITGRGETTTQGRAVGFFSLSRDHEHHFKSMRCRCSEVLTRSHVMLCIVSVKLCHSGCQAQPIHFHSLSMRLQGFRDISESHGSTHSAARDISSFRPKRRAICTLLYCSQSGCCIIGPSLS